jgi:hypothetical protein
VTLVSLSDDPQPLLICAATYRRLICRKCWKRSAGAPHFAPDAECGIGGAGVEICRPASAYLASRSLARLLHERNAGDPVFCQEMDFFLQADAKVWDSLSQALQAVDACRFKTTSCLAWRRLVRKSCWKTAAFCFAHG